MGSRYEAGSVRPGLPPDPPPLPNLGVAGLLHYWHPSRANLLADNTVSGLGWSDGITTDTDNLTRSVFEAGSPEPLHGVDANGYEYIEIAGIDLVGAKHLDPTGTALLICQMDPAIHNVQIARTGGVSVSRASNGRFKAQFATGTSPVSAADTSSASAADGLHIILVNTNPTAAALAIDNRYQTVGAYTPGLSANMVTMHQTGVGATGNPVGTYKSRLYAQAWWPFALSQADMDTVYQAAKATWTTLP